MTDADLAAVTAGCELKPGESVDRYRIGLDPADVAEEDGGGALGQQPTDAVTETRQIGTSDRAANRERDRLGP
jgi:hypothetical protein